MEQLIKHLQNIKVATQLMRVTGDISETGKSNVDYAVDEAIKLAKNNSVKADVISSCDCNENECCYYCEFEKCGTRNLHMPS